MTLTVSYALHSSNNWLKQHWKKVLDNTSLFQRENNEVIFTRVLLEVLKYLWLDPINIGRRFVTVLQSRLVLQKRKNIVEKYV